MKLDVGQMIRALEAWRDGRDDRTIQFYCSVSCNGWRVELCETDNGQGICVGSGKSPSFLVAARAAITGAMGWEVKP